MWNKKFDHGWLCEFLLQVDVLCHDIEIEADALDCCQKTSYTNQMHATILPKFFCNCSLNT